MTIEEFYEAGGPMVSESTYEHIEDIYTAYNRFNDKVQIASFCREHGSEGIEILKKPLEEYRALKRVDEGIQQEMAELQEKIQKLKERRDNILAKENALAIQYDLSCHWRQWS